MTVLCLGDVLVDVIARLPGELEPGSDRPAPIRAQGGGAAANTACWLAAAGVEVVLTGRIGTDPFGAWMAADLAAHGVIDALGRDPGHPTGTCIVLVSPGGERTMVPDAGANAALRPADLSVTWFRPAAHLHLSGYTLLGPARTAGVRALTLARDAGMTVSVDAASAAPLRAAGDFLDLIGSGLTLFANQDEAVVLTGLDDPADAVMALAARVGTAVVKLGAAGALWSDGASVLAEPAVVDVAVLDTTGAGDAFAAGYLSVMAAAAEPEEPEPAVPPSPTVALRPSPTVALRPSPTVALRPSPTVALRRGHALAARACTVVGGRPPRN